MALFTLIAKLGLDKTGFDAGLTTAQKSVGRFAAGLKSQLAAAFSVAALTAYTRSLVEYASKVKDASTRTGASTDALQTLGHAAKMTGSDFDAVVRSFRDLSRARQEALDKPGSEGAQVFKALGIDAQKLKDMKLEDIFREIGRAFELNDFGASELRMVTELLGRGGAELLPMFKEGLGQLEQAARDAGVVLGNELIDPLDEIGDQLDELIAQIRGPFASALVETLTTANGLLRQMGEGFKTIIGYIYGFKKGFEKSEAKDDMPVWLQILLGVKTLRKGKPGNRLEDAHKEAMELLDFEANKQKEKVGGEQGNPEDGLFFGFAKDQKQERRRREFNFAEAVKAVRPFRQQPSDELGRIGGGVGAGESTTNRQLRDLVREMKELRRTLELRGVRINGEL